MLISIYFILTLAVCSITAVPLNPLNDLNYNLPKDIVQVKQYDIHLTISNSTLEGDLLFKGTTTIEITALKNTTIIPLHSKVVSINSTQITNKWEPTDTQNIEINDSDLNNETDILTLQLNQELKEHAVYILEFKYIGKLSTDDMYGFYRSSYVNENNEVVYLATTQFQATHARKAFPCFDEPSFKAHFKISITHPRHLTALGNTVGTIATNDADGQNVLTEFELTPIMSTYLIAFIVSDFVCEEGPVKLFGNISQYVCSRPEAEESRKYALEITPYIVEELEKYTNIRYGDSGITKLHQVAIPDFAAGAMENWGLVTYRETALLWDEDVSNSYKQRVATVITHELAHQWFGNWVTTHWWADTFLNEGFATFFETFSTALVEPKWDLEQQFVIDDVQYALNADSFSSSNALSHAASSPSEIMARFNTISYSKGGSILRMIESILGKEQFKQGLQQYLQKTSFSMGTTALLIENLQANTSAANLPSNLNLSTVLENWIEKPGYPLLSVEESNNDLVISQTRFLLSGDVNPNEKWYVPISYAKSTDLNKEDASPKNWLTLDNNLTIVNGNDALWTILNVRETGFYRVDYSDSLLSKIKTGLMRTNFNNINEMNRAQLVDDLFNLARIRKRSYSSVFEFISFLSKDTSYPVWKTTFSSFSLLMQRTGDENIRQALSTFILQLMDTLYKSVPFEDHDSLDHVYTLKQVLAYNWACSLGHSDCRASAIDEFNKYMNTTQKPPTNFRSIIYCNALRQSSNAQADWNFLWDELHKTKSATEIVTIISSLGCVTNTTILNEYLLLSINPNSGIRSQDALSVFSSVYSGSPEGVDIALNFLIENHQEIEIYYNSMNAITSMFSGLANRIIKEDQIQKLEEFANSNIATDVQEAATNALSTIRTNLAWTTFLEEEMRAHFDLESPNSAISAKICITLLISVVVLHFLTN